MSEYKDKYENLLRSVTSSQFEFVINYHSIRFFSSEIIEIYMRENLSENDNRSLRAVRYIADTIATEIRDKFYAYNEIDREAYLRILESDGLADKIIDRKDKYTFNIALGILNKDSLVALKLIDEGFFGHGENFHSDYHYNSNAYLYCDDGDALVKLAKKVKRRKGYMEERMLILLQALHNLCVSDDFPMAVCENLSIGLRGHMVFKCLEKRKWLKNNKNKFVLRNETERYNNLMQNLSDTIYSSFEYLHVCHYRDTCNMIGIDDVPYLMPKISKFRRRNGDVTDRIRELLARA